MNCPLPAPLCELGVPLSLHANFHGVLTDHPTVFYRYDVTIKGTSKDVEDFTVIKPIFFTKKSGCDVYALDRKQKCAQALKFFMEKNTGIWDSTKGFYDCAATLYTMSKLNMDEGSVTKIMKLDEAESALVDGVKTFEITIAACSENATVDVNALKQQQYRTTIDLSRDRSVLQLIEIVVLQMALDNPETFLCFENAKVYFKQTLGRSVDLPDGKEIKCGAKVSAQFIEGPRGRDGSCVAMALDVKKVAFHKEEPLPLKAMDILRDFDFSRPCPQDKLDKLRTVLRGLMIETIHTHKKYKIIGLTGNALSFFEHDGQKITVAEYFKTKYNIQLKAPYAPLVSVQSKFRINLPMEVCTVCPDQRVAFVQQTPEQMRLTTRACAMPPDERLQLVRHTMDSLGLTDPNFQSRTGLRLTGGFLNVNARKIDPPIMLAAGNVNVPVGAKFTWTLPRGRFLIPAAVNSWSFLGIGRSARGKKWVANKVLDECCKRGIKMPSPLACDEVNDDNSLEEYFKWASSKAIQFVFIVTDVSLHIQDRIKSLERKYEILTQNITSNTANVIDKRPVTLENIVNKINTKFGGINYSIKVNGHSLLQKGNTLVLGIGAVATPAGMMVDVEDKSRKIPNIVGYAGNFGAELEAFCGDFEVIDDDFEKEAIGDRIVRLALRQWKLNSKADVRSARQDMPSHLVIYRIGLNEGSLQKMLQSEIPAIRRVLEEFGKVSLTYISTSKDHAIRLFRRDILAGSKPTEQNIPSGTVVDSRVTHPNLRQFYLNSHVTLQGSAVTPVYTVLADDEDMPMDNLIDFTYKLCYMHEIVFMPTSLPTPLYVANRYADRGRRMIVQKCKEMAANNEAADWTDIAGMMCYRESKFCNIRLNA